MTCPVCGGDTAPNAFGDDKRCAPCHNWRVVSVGPFSVNTSHDSRTWINEARAGLERAGNLDNFYRGWLARLEAAVNGAAKKRGWL